MTWIKLDDRCPRHPKIAGLSDRAFRWWIAGLCYASEFLTDGVLPYVFLRTAPKTVQTELRKAGLWRTDERGDVHIHDYLAHQQDRATVERKLAQNRGRQSRWRNSVTNGVTNGVTDAPTDAARNGTLTLPDADVDADTPTDAESRGRAAAGAASTGRVVQHQSLIRNSIDYDRALQRCAYVGARLEIPKKLHADLVRDTGGADAPTRLLAWYADLDTRLEASGEAIAPDVFKWVTAQWRVWVRPAAVVDLGGVPGVEETRRMLREAEARAGQ